MNTYKIELPDGKVETRNTKRTFSHAVIVRDVLNGNDRGWGSLAYAGSYELASKSMAQAESRYNSPRNNGCFAGTEFRIVKVEIA